MSHVPQIWQTLPEKEFHGSRSVVPYSMCPRPSYSSTVTAMSTFQEYSPNPELSVVLSSSLSHNAYSFSFLNLHNCVLIQIFLWCV